MCSPYVHHLSLEEKIETKVTVSYTLLKHILRWIWNTSQNSYISEDSKRKTTAWTMHCQDCKWLQIWPYFQANIILPQFHDASERYTLGQILFPIAIAVFSLAPGLQVPGPTGGSKESGDAYKSSMLPYKRETLELRNPNLLQLYKLACHLLLKRYFIILRKQLTSSWRKTLLLSSKAALC